VAAIEGKALLEMMIVRISRGACHNDWAAESGMGWGVGFIVTKWRNHTEIILKPI
jgi:hypothetical protein